MTAEARDEFFQLNKERLEQLAFRATQRGLTPNQFITICIDVDDPSWTEVVDVLMPGYNWQEIRDRGEKPVARGTVTPQIADYIAEVVPDVAPALMDQLPPAGVVTTIVLGDGGASVYYIEPTPPFKGN